MLFSCNVYLFLLIIPKTLVNYALDRYTYVNSLVSLISLTFFYLSFVSELIPSRKCADEDVGPLRGVDCDDLSGRVQGTDSYLVSDPTSPGWLRKGLKEKRFPSIKIKAFSEHLAKGFVGTPKSSVLKWE